jgi:hypothetical protein
MVTKLENEYADWWQGKYTLFKDKGPYKPGSKTRLFAVMNRLNKLLLGHVHWYGPWRKYIFSPEPYVIFDDNCLAEIGDFTALRTFDHKELWPIKLTEEQREKRKELYRKNRLTKEAKRSTLENVSTVVQPENGLVEGGQGQETLTPLEMELGVVDF